MLKSLITGPMFAGKTTSLISVWQRFISVSDWEYFRLTTEDVAMPTKERFKTHDHMVFYGWKVSNLEQIETSSQFILLDEVQFAKPEHVDAFLRKFKGRKIIAAGLDFDFHRVEFEATKAFRKHAKEVAQRWAFCEYCSNRAYFSRKISSKNPDARFDEQARYVPCCGDCWEQFRKYEIA